MYGRKDPKHHVHVIGHDTPGEQMVALAIEMAQRLRDHTGYGRMFEMTGTRARVQILFDDLRR